MLPIVATLLLMPPLIWIFAAPATIGGVPLVVAYVVAIWGAIILVALVVARHTARIPEDSQEQPNTQERP